MELNLDIRSLRRSALAFLAQIVVCALLLIGLDDLALPIKVALLITIVVGILGVLVSLAMAVLQFGYDEGRSHRPIDPA